MSVLARTNWIGQQRVDLHDFLMSESFQAFDIRSLVTSLVGTDKAYVARGLEVVGKTGLTIQVKVADSLIFNPLDGNGSFYVGLADDANISVTLPANQANIFVEARFRNESQAPVTKASWDPLALTGEDASGTEFQTSVNSQVVTTLEIVANTVGFSAGAVPLLRASTSASAITSMADSRDLLYRLGTGGTSPNPLNQYDWSSTRTEPVPTGTGVGDALDSPWRARDTIGAINDKAFRSLKELTDAMMTRISEISGSFLWYVSGVSTAPVANVSLNQLYFDTIGHSIQPDATAAFVWKKVSGTLRLAGEGTKPLVSGSYHEGLIQWQSNNSKVKWHLGGTFSSATFRNYSLVRFTSPSPIDGGNIYLKLEREVPKGSGASVQWANNTAQGAFTATKAVSGQAGDFTGIALGDFVRKQSEGYSRYYKVLKFSDGTNIFNNATPTEENKVADSTIIALELEDLIQSGVSIEPLRFFRTRYSDTDLYADTTSSYIYQDADFYWLGRRVGDLFILRGYGTLQENEEISTLNDAFSVGNQEQGLVVDHAKEAIYDATNGYSLKTGAGTLVTLYRRKRDNTISTPSSSDNTNSLISYTIAAPIGLIPSGSNLWVRLSDTTGGAITNGSVINSTDDLDNTDLTTNKWEVRTAANSPTRTRDNQDVFLLARRVVIGGQAALLFFDGSILGEYGNWLNQNVEIGGELKLTNRPTTSVLFAHPTITGQVDSDTSNFFYNKTSQQFGLFNFRITNNVIDINTSADVSILPNLDNFTATIGHADSTIYIPGDLIVAGNTVAAQVSQIQSEDKVITLGVGNLNNGGYNSGIEVADNTIAGTNFASTSGSTDVVLTLASAPAYALTDIIGISAIAGIGGITAGQIGGQYTIVGSLSAAGQATLSGSVLTLRTAVAATSTASSGANVPSAFKPEHSFKVSASDGTLTSGITSWRFQVKNVITTPTLTPVANYGTVPTAHHVNMVANRIPFVNDDNAGPAGADTTLNFSNNFTWNNSTSLLTVLGNFTLGGNFLPNADDTYDLGSAAFQWRYLYIGPGSDSGIIAGTDTNLYRSAANQWKTDDAFEIGGITKQNVLEEFVHQTSTPIYSSTVGVNRIWNQSGIMLQRTHDGQVQALTNPIGSIYEEIVEVVAVPVGNNQMAPISSFPTTVTIPKDTNKYVGSGILATTDGTTAVVIVSKLAHGLTTGDLATITTSSAIGGISALNLSQVNTTITVLSVDAFSYVAGGVSSIAATGTLDLVRATNTTRAYRVGEQEIDIYRNGQRLMRGLHYNEVGSIGSNSALIQFLTQPAIIATEHIVYEIKANGGQVVISGAGGGGGGSLQAAYGLGSSITITSGNPVTINGPVSEKLLVINGDIDVTGVIDPKGITFTLESSDPLSASNYGLWVNSSGELIYKRGTSGSPINLTQVASASGRVFNNNSGSTIAAVYPVSCLTNNNITATNPANEASSRKIVGITKTSINNAASGEVLTSGVLSGITTGFADGSVLYVAKSGGLTDVEPSIGVGGFVIDDFVVKIGLVVENASNPALQDLIINMAEIGQL